jgi:nucleoside-diphosphate-sugar epimerase
MTTSDALHVIFGAGAVGIWTARALRGDGHPVRVVNRSGSRPALLPDDVEVVAADATDTGQATAAAQGAAVVYQALNPAYHRWPQEFPGLQAGALAAAAAVGARYVSIDNLYMYGRVTGPIRPDSPQQPHTVKGRLRAAMAADVLTAHHAGRIRASVLRSADYYGPGVTGSALGERTFRPLLAGKPAEVLGSADIRHAFAYIEDVGRAAAVLGTRDEALGGVWFTPHAPAETQRATLAPAFDYAGLPPKIRVMGGAMLRLGGLFVPEARAGVEMLYEFTEPFEVDSSATEQTFGLAATPLVEGMRRTVDYYRELAAATR